MKADIQKYTYFRQTDIFGTDTVARDTGIIHSKW